MSIMAVMMIALGSVMAGWKQQGISQATYLTNRQAVVRIQNLVRSAKLIGLVRAGSLSSNTSNAAVVVLWKSDTSGGTVDRAIQFSEVGMLIHDRSTKTLKYYSVTYPASLTAGQIAAAEKTYTYSDLCNSSAPEDFKALNYVGAVTVATNVSGATFYANQVLGQSSQLPTFEFQVAFTRNGNTSQVYGSTALRNPDFKPTP
jgi:hypothetical protein